MILYGASGHGKVVLSICDDKTKCFVDDNEALTHFAGKPVYRYSDITDENISFVISIGNNSIRRNISRSLLHKYCNVISTIAHIPSDIIIGTGNQILHCALIQVGTVIGSHTIINSSASIDHDCVIDDFVHIAPNATICGNVHIGEGSLIGAGSTIIPGIKVGKWSIIGAGSVVVSDIPDNVMAFGNPAKIIKKIE